MSRNARDNSIGALLAFTAGFVDTAGFIALFGLFTAHVTGNFVLIGASIAAFHVGILGKLLALPVFVLVVALTRLYVLQAERRKTNAAGASLLSEFTFLLLFMAVGVAAAPFTDADAPLTIATGMMGVVAMAVQNAAARTVFATLSPTTVMTGNVTQIVIDLVDLAMESGQKDVVRARLAKMAPPVATFALGALAGALSYVWVGFWCLALPMSAILAAFVLSQASPPATEAA
ncbi:MAG: DUF1275 domain-containing protein [Rhodospirillaceae bacterium]|nr:DUF1275 domain-containing protein [Rhodospirillaceae bacterium]